MMEPHLLNKSLDAQQKLTWLWLNSGCDWITGLTCGPIALHSISNVGLIILKCLRQSLSSEWWFNSLPEESHMIAFTNTNIWTQDNMTVFIAFSSARSETQVIYDVGQKKSKSCSPNWSNFNFYYRYVVPISQEVMLLFTWTHGMETLLYSQMYYAIFQFSAQVKFATLDGNIASEDSSMNIQLCEFNTILKSLLLCFTEERKSYMFGTTQR